MKPAISDIITYLRENLSETDITLYPGANPAYIERLENFYHTKLPDDVREFYEFADGFFSDEDQFRIVPFGELVHKYNGNRNLFIAEYMIYCDMWELVIDPVDSNSYQIVSGSVVLTNSLGEFISRFFRGGVFEKGGIYDWKDEVVVNNIWSSENTVDSEFIVKSFLRTDTIGLILTGDVVVGEVSQGNYICIEIDEVVKPFTIFSIEDVRSENGGSVGLRLSCGDPDFDDVFEKLVGETIYIYQLP